MSDGFWGLLGVVIGGLITFFSQYIFSLHKEKIKNRKLFLKQHFEIINNIIILKNALGQFYSFVNMDLSKHTNEELERELYHSIINFSNKCSNIWFDFRDIILTYFYKSIDDKSLFILDSVMCNIINANPGTKYIDFELFRNIHNSLQNSGNEFKQALKLITDIEEKYHEINRGILKKKI